MSSKTSPTLTSSNINIMAEYHLKFFNTSADTKWWWYQQIFVDTFVKFFTQKFFFKLHLTKKRQSSQMLNAV